MEPSLRALRRVKLHSITYTLRHWKACFSRFEKVGIVVLALAFLMTSWGWALAASKTGESGPIAGGTFVEGVVTNDLDSVDLGHLVKSSLVMLNNDDQFVGDLAEKWEISSDSLSYTFDLKDGVSAAEIINTIGENPTYFPGVSTEFVSSKRVIFKLESPDGLLLSKLTKPVFSYGPYKLDKKTKNEIRLVRDKGYFGEKPLIDKFIIRSYSDQDKLQKAANKNQITGAIGLTSTPTNWQQKTVTLNQKHVLFINSSKTNLKSTKTRESLLNGEKPAKVDSLDILEVNGVSHDKDYEDLKEKLKASGVQLNIRQVSMKDALKEDLPKRNYDMLYILLSEDVSRDPYELWNSQMRSSDGQNFAEVANATLDSLTLEYRKTSDITKQRDILTKIDEVVANEKIAVEYKNLETAYSISPKLKGFSLSAKAISEAGRFNYASTWYFFEGRK